MDHSTAGGDERGAQSPSDANGLLKLIRRSDDANLGQALIRLAAAAAAEHRAQVEHRAQAEHRAQLDDDAHRCEAALRDEEGRR